MPEEAVQIKEFEDQFKKAGEARKAGVSLDALTDLSKFESKLGKEIENEFNKAVADRQLKELVWLQDLRQFRGEYDPELLQKMHPKRSKAYLSLTRTKVKTISARETDLLFPANGDKNWGITPSPIPELDPAIIQSITLQYQEQTGELPDEDMIRQFINEEAKRRSEAMEKEIEDQLSEIKYRAAIRDTILSGNLYGTGVLKGPLAKTTTTTRYLPHGKEFIPVQIKSTKPYAEHVPIWDLYLDMSARTPENVSYIFQRYVMTRAKVFELAKRDDFNKDAIIAYLKANPDGNASYLNHEEYLRSMNIEGSDQTTSIPDRKGRYQIVERWGYMSAEKLMEAGIEIDEDQYGLELAVNVWLLGDIIIKAIIAPIEGVVFPFHIYYYDKDDSSIWGNGIAYIMRDPQKLFNAGVRAMMDNAAISAGPIIEANVDLLDADEDPRDLYPFRVFIRDGQGMEAQSPAIRVETLPSYTSEFMALIQFFRDMADEIPAIPRYLWGETSKMGGAGRTATGLSMMMGAANITLKDQVKNFDDGITKPFIRAMYFWNMEFNPKPHIKGDFNIVARGSSSLIAREVKAESLNQFIAIVASNPELIPYVQMDNILREMVKIMDLDDMNLIKDPNQVRIENEARRKQAEEDRKFEQDLAMTKARSGGHMDEAVRTPGQAPGMQPLSRKELEEGVVPGVEV